MTKYSTLGIIVEIIRVQNHYTLMCSLESCPFGNFKVVVVLLSISVSISRSFTVYSKPLLFMLIFKLADLSFTLISQLSEVDCHRFVFSIEAAIFLLRSSSVVRCEPPSFPTFFCCGLFCRRHCEAIYSLRMCTTLLQLKHYCLTPNDGLVTLSL